MPIDHGPRVRARLALTFDDGPGRVTDAVLEVLARHGARATFNVLGERIGGRERMLRAILAAGHELGSHAFRHERLGSRPLAAYSQLRRTSAALRAAVGVRPGVFRPPYGSAGPGLVLAARAAGLVTVGWDVNPHDYELPGAAAIERCILDAAGPGSIIVLHDDRRAREQTAVALDAVLPRLRERELEPVTVSELLGLG